MYNDADIETAELEAAARHNAALASRGICVHGWTQGGVDKEGNLRSGHCVKCLECGRIFKSEDDCHHSRIMARDEGVKV